MYIDTRKKRYMFLYGAYPSIYLSTQLCLAAFVSVLFAGVLGKSAGDPQGAIRFKKTVKHGKGFGDLTLEHSSGARASLNEDSHQGHLRIFARRRGEERTGEGREGEKGLEPTQISGCITTRILKHQ